MTKGTWPPHITVATIVQLNGTYLMVEEEADGQLVLNQPAGHLDPGEDIFTAALRETREETGWLVELTAFTGFYQYQAASTLFHRFAFTANVVGESGEDIDPDITAVHWLTLDEIRQRRHRSPMVEKCITDAAGGSYPLSLIQRVQA